MNPVIKKEIIKKQGLKMTRKILDFTIEDNNYLDLKTLTTKQRSLLVDEIDPLPSWFNKDEYIKKYWKSFEKFLSENKSLKKQIDSFQEKKSVGNVEKFQPVIQELYDVTLKISDKWYTANMAEFFESDLPFDLYDRYNISFTNRLKILEVVKNNIRLLVTKLHLHRSNEIKTQHDLDYYKSQMEHLVAARMAASDAEDLLRFYIKIRNATSMDDLFKIIPLRMDKLDKQTFKEYFEQFKHSTNELTNLLRIYLPQNKMPSTIYPESKALDGFKRDLGQFILNYD